MHKQSIVCMQIFNELWSQNCKNNNANYWLSKSGSKTANAIQTSSKFDQFLFFSFKAP